VKSQDKKSKKYVLVASIIVAWNVLLSNLRNKGIYGNKFSHIRIRYNDNEIKSSLLD